MSDDIEYESDDAKQVRDRKAAEKRSEKLKTSDLKELMSQACFRRFMWHYLERANIFSVPSPLATPRETGFFDGQKNLFLQIFADLHEHCEQNYALMVSESKKEGNTYDD